MTAPSIHIVMPFYQYSLLPTELALSIFLIGLYTDLSQ
uniref:Uncharacterized protein n=1 Tax=virus sp. ctML55 TaxID=2827627 RepID=A0A8S5RHW0_9VIRU|nr:MAG TPA: hypothetical protein [virus sp. ctML55]